MHLSFFYFLATLCSIRNFPNQGLNLCCLQWEPGVLTSGKPGKSDIVILLCFTLLQFIDTAFFTYFLHIWASQVVRVVKNLLASAGDIRDKGSIPESGRSPGGGHGHPSSVLAWRIPWTEEPGGPQSMQSHRVKHDWSDLARMQRYCIFYQMNVCGNLALSESIGISFPTAVAHFMTLWHIL